MYPGRSLKKSAFFPAVGAAQPSGRYALTGPAHVLDAARWPVRGDLAHMALAGRCFVPHYVVPMAYVLVAPAPLRAAPRDSGDVRAMLAVGARFDVMDIVGGWAWRLSRSSFRSRLSRWRLGLGSFRLDRCRGLLLRFDYI